MDSYSSCAPHVGRIVPALPITHAAQEFPPIRLLDLIAISHSHRALHPPKALALPTPIVHGQGFSCLASCFARPLLIPKLLRFDRNSQTEWALHAPKRVTRPGLRVAA